MVQLDDRATADVAHTRRAAASFAPPQEESAFAWLRRFSSKYGWRAYALPVLAVITVLALLNTGGSSPKQDAQQPPAPTAPGNTPPAGAPPPPVASGNTSIKQDQASGSINAQVLKGAALPAGPAYTIKGTGKYTVVKGTSAKVGKGKLYRYSIEVEQGITGVDVAQFAQEVQTVLSDKRSWAGHGDVTLQRVDSGHVDFHVSLSSSDTTAKWCGNELHIETSCYQVGHGNDPSSRVVMNVSRWVRGATAYVGDLASYRIYMINHEDGHALGHNHAHQCLPDGQAPVMLQQTIGMTSAATGKQCTANPWPYPPGVKGTPGAEQPDTAQNSEVGLSD